MKYSNEEKHQLDELVDYFRGRIDESDLTAKQKEVADRIDFADNIIRQYPDRKTCVQMILKHYPDISQSTAYRIYSSAKYVFGSANRFDAEYERMVLVEEQKRLIRVMWNANPVKYAKHIINASGLIAKVLGLDKPVEEKINPEDLLQHNYIMMLNLNAENISLLHLSQASKLKDEEKSKLLDEYLRVTEERQYAEIIGEG